jgi:hypothetical protein
MVNKAQNMMQKHRLYCLSLYTAMFWYHFLALLTIVLSVPLYGYVLVLFFCALLTIVLSVPLYGYVLVSLFVLIGHCIVCLSIRLCFGIGTNNTMANKAKK